MEIESPSVPLDFEVATLLTSGLKATFDGTNKGKTITAEGVLCEERIMITPAGSYRDVWPVNMRLMDGKETVVTNEGKTWTRVYKGGDAEPEILHKLGIGHADIMTYLTQVLVNHISYTRMNSDFDLTDGDWEYRYVVTGREPAISLIQGKETIKYKNEVVFVHTFAISPVGN